MVDQDGAEAHRFSWTVPQQFGVHPEYSFLRIGHASALMVHEGRVFAIETDPIVIECFSGARTTPGQTRGPPVREFVA